MAISVSLVAAKCGADHHVGLHFARERRPEMGGTLTRMGPALGRVLALAALICAVGFAGTARAAPSVTITSSG